MSEFDIRQAVPQKQDSTFSQSLKGEIAEAGAEVNQRAREALRASKDMAVTSSRRPLALPRKLRRKSRITSGIRPRSNSDPEPTSSTGLLATFGKRPMHSKTTRRLPRAASIPAPTTWKMLPRRFAMAPSRSRCRGLRFRETATGCLPGAVGARRLRSCAFL